MTIKWPEDVRCHITSPDDPRHAYREPAAWRPPEPDAEPYGYPYRTCTHCGSIHPEDFLHWLANGARLNESDWKYGWPHKFYVEDIPNPQAGKRVCNGSDNGAPTYGEGAKHTHAKWYNIHLKDLEGEAFEAVVAVLRERTKIEFSRDEKGIKFRSIG
jgi:hypothetical protein